LEIIVF